MRSIKKKPLFLVCVALINSLSCSSGNQLKAQRKKGYESPIIREVLKNIQYTENGAHLFGHESTITMGVKGAYDWNIVEENTKVSANIFALRSDVREMTGELPAIIGYDAFKLILDITDGPAGNPNVATSLAALKLYRENGGLIAFNWHMQPIGLPDYRERAYRMDEFQNNPYIETMKETKPFYQIANGFETKDWWWIEFETKRLAPMVKRLKCISVDGSGIIMRPFHEFDGDWFWWGLKWLEGDKQLNGKDALLKVFIETARYLKQRLPEILIAFSSDKLDYVSHDNVTDEEEIVKRYQEAFASYLPKNEKDLDLIDIYGMDLYTSAENPLPSRERFRLKLKGLSLIAKEHQKIGAITEAGNRGIPSEEDERQPSINWYNDFLLSWVSDPEINVAYTVIWQNWSNNRNPQEQDLADGYFVPFNSASPAGKDFINYVKSEKTLMLGDFNKKLVDEHSNNH